MRSWSLLVKFIVTHFQKYKYTFSSIEKLIDNYDYLNALNKCFELIGYINKRINDERPYDKESTNSEEIITEGYVILKYVSNIIKIIIPEYNEKLDDCFDKKEKVILFNKI